MTLKILTCSDGSFSSSYYILLANKFPNKLGPSLLNSKLRNSQFFSFALFSIALQTPFNNKLDSSKDLANYFDDILHLVIWNYQFCSSKVMNFLLNSCVFAEVVAVNSNGIKTLLANGLSTFLICSDPVFY